MPFSHWSMSAWPSTKAATHGMVNVAHVVVPARAVANSVSPKTGGSRSLEGMQAASGSMIGRCGRLKYLSIASFTMIREGVPDRYICPAGWRLQCERVEMCTPVTGVFQAMSVSHDVADAYG